ncbi:hypothetical protein OsccyDRAFT_0058 [Leptolyngbyaceae cyanobacterium JSC-12]|nr:hypothetical protein OsccyDRAFT_0058 [Leptolyngbyaceae cyanobacterium JSC-12]
MEKLPTILIPTAITDAIATSKDSLPWVLKQTQSPVGMHYKPPKGHSEIQFEQDLWQYFPNRIHTGLMMPRPGHDQPYVPDFAYIDPILNLYIDIEVDEPYTHNTRQPLHYADSEKDQQRNQFFLEAGWIVIRFSELQVVKMPMSCCKVIASTIASITQDNTLMNPFRQVPTLKPEQRWSYEEAQHMIKTAYREQYLPAPQSDFSSKPRKSRKSVHSAHSRSPIRITQFTFYCSVCGEGPLRWKGSYIACPTCGAPATTSDCSL